jgi:hypothetical protein
MGGGSGESGIRGGCYGRSVEGRGTWVQLPEAGLHPHRHVDNRYTQLYCLYILYIFHVHR